MARANASGRADVDAFMTERAQRHARPELRERVRYWNAVCLKQIGAPKFWSKETLGPLLARFHKEPDPAAVSRPATCKK